MIATYERLGGEIEKLYEELLQYDVTKVAADGLS